MAAAAACSRGGGGSYHRQRPPSSKALAVRPPTSTRRRPVCTFWLKGRCIRRPCPFLHQRDDPPPRPPSPVHHPPPPQQNHHDEKAPPPQHLQGRRPPPTRFVWRKPNLAAAPVSSSPSPGDDEIKKSTATRAGDAPECAPPTRGAPPPLGDGDTDDGRDDHGPHGGGQPTSSLPVVTFSSPNTPGDNDAQKDTKSCGGGEDAPECSPPTLGAPPLGDGYTDDGRADHGPNNGGQLTSSLPVVTCSSARTPGDDDAQKDTNSCSGGEDASECSPPTLGAPLLGDGDTDDGRADHGPSNGGQLTSSLPVVTCSSPRTPGDDDAQKDTNSCGGGDTQESTPPTPSPLPPCRDRGDDINPALPEGRSSVFMNVLGGGTGERGHQKAVTGIAFSSRCDKLFSSSRDGSVRVWESHSGRCIQVIELGGGPIACLITDGHWVFAGARGAVNGCDTLRRTGRTLPVPAGQVCSLVTSFDMLFAGVEDGRVFAWKVTLDAAAAGDDGFCFLPAAALSGHTSAVVSLAVDGGRLYSGSVDGVITAWDVNTLRCCYTLSAHEDAVTSLLRRDGFLLSCSLDGTVKLWSTAAEGGMEVVHTHQEAHGVVCVQSAQDAQGRPMLVCSLSDGTVHLYDGSLPSLRSRGTIGSRKGLVRALHSGPGGLVFTGDETGEIKVWRWSET